MDKWLKIQKLFHRGVFNWDESHDMLTEHNCPNPTDFIGTREEYEQAMADAGF